MCVYKKYNTDTQTYVYIYIYIYISTYIYAHGCMHGEGVLNDMCAGVSMACAATSERGEEGDGTMRTTERIDMHRNTEG
eukprot:NODE_2264_length_808_cov_420.654809_g1581_i0.p3 GENE.NODE_2264_length_808_cov_420.654809_g1581_i0~~NODE_2264_length_808_cov_420.654809_g1581_i0.p3  ORF type:complete len:79 (-),score=14.32 NODE_2264_length_808_cov_420.654809_g1581_i0:216-452(-)